ncbi:class I SAM-dependent methyltransferase [Streptomonospora wellingtoniae]|uniref:Class I SAM-dependent methyltransferase n=1 Tax=Streptomonospora wellingtoniae TaxID=3075544 RepID=A0ABU2KWN5_9ACTN|nr:class I SAM-dependent methyltransferase [Streptomonospora sp. DSM 45055]MDT0303710.1 class I SAM-dependent methyltransferase [Streptomonospora sp. DSM 45055]
MSATDADPARRVDDLLRGAWVLAALARAADTGDPLEPELGEALGAAGCAERSAGRWRLLPEYRALVEASRPAGRAALPDRIGRMLHWAADAAQGRPADAREHSDAELRDEGDESGRGFAALLDTLAGADADLRALLGCPHLHFLDVGTGTGAVAAAVAERVPGAGAVGVDRDAHVLGLAAERVERAGLGDRLRLRRQDVSDLADSGAFDLVWLPLSVLTPEAARAALPRVRAALRPGGILIAATALQEEPRDRPGPRHEGPDRDRLAYALTRWRMARAGIAAWTPGEAADRLREAGFAAVRRPGADGHAAAAVLAGAPSIL